MSNNPLTDTPERGERIRRAAYNLWEEDGRPEGRADDHWERASFLIRMEDSAGAGQLPNPVTKNEALPGPVVEEPQI